MIDEVSGKYGPDVVTWKGPWLALVLGIATTSGMAQSVHYEKARAFQRVGLFDSALFYYQKSNSGDVTDKAIRKQIEKRITECISGRKLSEEPRNFIITNLGSQINSAFEDYAPVLTGDERMLVFTSRRSNGNTSNQKDSEGNYFEDVFFAHQENDHWLMAQNVGSPINTSFHDSNLALSADGKQLYLYTDENGGDILVSEFENDHWKSPRRMPFPINTPYHESSISVSPDGRRVFVASERPGGIGGSDIYVIEKTPDGQWLSAENLGPEINTEWDEDSPFIDSEGHALYFSSTGHNSIGGYDLFRSLEKGGVWSGAENLGVPINTPQNDSYFVSTSDGKRAYYSSVRPGGFGKEDIYAITLPDELVRANEPHVVDEKIHEESVNGGAISFGVVYFEFGTAILSREMEAELNVLSEKLKLNVVAIVQLDGHTDNRGPERFNYTLSLARAQSVGAYLQSKGVEPNKISVRGWSFRRPMVSNEDEIDGRALNRRVEIRVINN